MVPSRSGIPINSFDIVLKNLKNLQASNSGGGSADAAIARSIFPLAITEWTNTLAAWEERVVEAEAFAAQQPTRVARSLATWGRSCGSRCRGILTFPHIYNHHHHHTTPVKPILTVSRCLMNRRVFSLVSFSSEQSHRSRPASRNPVRTLRRQVRFSLYVEDMACQNKRKLVLWRR